MTNNKVLYISQEIHPYLPESTLSLLGRNVPTGLQSKGFEVRTFMPKYGMINERRNQLHEVIRLSGINLVIDDTDHPLILKVATLQPSRMQVYFIDNDDYFSRTSKDLETTLSPDDNDERIMFFTQGVVETAKKLRWQPAIIHCSGWVSALAPLYLRRKYADDPAFANVKIIFSLYDGGFDGALDPRFVEKLTMAGFSTDDLTELGSDPVDAHHLFRLAVKYADAVVASTPQVPEDLVEYARSRQIPVLDYPGDDDRIEAYNQFYRSLIGE